MTNIIEWRIVGWLLPILRSFELGTILQVFVALCVAMSIAITALLYRYTPWWVASSFAVVVAAAFVHWSSHYAYGVFGWGLFAPTPLTSGAKDPTSIRFVCISDTHNKHHDLTLPDGDVLIHTGDFSKRGTIAEITDFITWFDSQPHKYKILVSGNHDLLLDPDVYSEHWASWVDTQESPEEAAELIANSSITYLLDESVEIHGIKIYASPYTAIIRDVPMAFSRHKGNLAKEWSKIPKDVDVLMTHSPPHGTLDQVVFGGGHVGCKALKNVVARIKPKYHIFGHIHESYGVVEKDGVTYINAASVTTTHKAAHPPVVFDLPAVIPQASSDATN